MKRFLIILVMVSWCSVGFALSECKGTDYSKWTNCNGTWVSSSSTAKYIGEFKNGKFHGQGTFAWAHGDKYVGEYKDGKKHGQGTYTYAKGSKYVGQFKDDKWHGQGTYTIPKKNYKYVGEFKDGQKHGPGTITWKNIGISRQSKLVGEWKDGNEHGQMTFTNHLGNKYVGKYKFGLFHGKGTYIWADGRKYVGEWEKGDRQGQGTFTWPDGKVDNGIWEKNKLVQRNEIKIQVAKKETTQTQQVADKQDIIHTAWRMNNIYYILFLKNGICAVAKRSLDSLITNFAYKSSWDESCEWKKYPDKVFFKITHLDKTESKYNAVFAERKIIGAVCCSQKKFLKVINGELPVEVQGIQKKLNSRQIAKINEKDPIQTKQVVKKEPTQTEQVVKKEPTQTEQVVKKEPTQTEEVVKKEPAQKTERFGRKEDTIRVASLKRKIEKEGVVPFDRESLVDESEYDLLIEQQYKFVKQEKKILSKDIDRAKELCKSMGFSEGLFFKSEKFSQCVLDIWITELAGKRYAAMQKELNVQLTEIKKKQIELDSLAGSLDIARKEQIALSETLTKQMARVSQNTKIQQSYQRTQKSLEKSKTYDLTNSLIKGALGLAASYYLGKALSGGSRGSQGSKGDPGITVRGYRCTLHPTAFDC